MSHFVNFSQTVLFAMSMFSEKTRVKTFGPFFVFFVIGVSVEAAGCPLGEILKKHKGFPFQIEGFDLQRIVLSSLFLKTCSCPCQLGREIPDVFSIC